MCERLEPDGLPGENSMIQATAIADAPMDTRRQTASRIFRAALAFNAALTVLWLVALVTGRTTMFFRDYTADLAAIGRVLGGVLFFYVIWGAIWWAIKTALLRWFVGFTKEERRAAFSSRMDRPYEVAALTEKYSERRIRIADMIGRRGRFITLAGAGFFYLYAEIGHGQSDRFATAFLQDNLFDAVLTNWIFLAFYYRSDWLAAWFYGAQSRVMDGVLARANCVLITTLWSVFKFVMVPLGAALAGLFTRDEFPAIFALIWGSYIAADACAEIFGSLFGRQRIRVWGVGDVNRKSIAGVVGGFVACLLLCVSVVLVNGLGVDWIVLSLVIATSNILLELWSPRGTDDFTMATANGLICLVFGLMRAG
jgi:hypothetical protein